ncbi:hypothetical protein ACSLOE_30735, partial [Escherichia coli]
QQMSFQLRHALSLLHQSHCVQFAVVLRPVRFGFHPLRQHQKTTVDTMDAHWKTVLKMSVKRWLWLIIVSVLMFATTGSLLW